MFPGYGDNGMTRTRLGKAFVHLLGAMLVVVAVVAGSSGPGFGQNAPTERLPTAVVAIIDVQRIMQNAKAAQSVRAQVQSFYDSGLAEITEREEELRGEQQKLARQRAVLTPQKYAESERAFRTQVRELEQRQRALDSQLQNILASAENDVRRAMVPIFADISNEKGITMIVGRTQIMFAVRAIEITDEVLARLDEALPEIAVALPETE